MSELECLNELSRLAPLMRVLQKDPQATVGYEIMSGSLVWSDEYPKVTGVSTDCLRYVFRYRTQVILGSPEPGYEQFWQEARKQFPEWIGFASERTAPNLELSQFYYRERERIYQDLEK